MAGVSGVSILMLCLGIETSCDDTALALVRDGKLAGAVRASQIRVHALFGGVVPELASREHGRLLGPLADLLFQEAGVCPDEVNVVAVARGPGLLGSLLVGISFAKAFAFGNGARFIGVNHLHAHLMAVGLERPVTFPAVGLLVSGGHTCLYAMNGPAEFTLLGRTLDDASGEAFDKAGKMLGLPYPAGRLMDQLAEEGTADPRLFPRPYLDNATLDFSFSGLKTAMATHLAQRPRVSLCWDPETGETGLSENRQAVADICASFRLAVVETLVEKTRRALRGFPEAKSLVLAGGVAANTLLRQSMARLAEEEGRQFLCPQPELCTDNGAMIAWLGWLLASRGGSPSLAMEAIPRGRAVPEDMIRDRKG